MAYAAPLTTLEYHIIGIQLQVTPAAVSVPKGVAGSVLVQLTGADGSTSVAAAGLGDGAYVEAVLRGPAFPARRVVGQLNAALLLPPLNLVGDYSLDSIRLVDAATQATRMEATPATVPIRVFDEVLVSRVTSRPLTLDEIKDKGIVIDEQNFRAVEFEVAFVLDGRTIPVRFPVVTPTFRQSTEIIPAAELEARLVEAEAINREISSGAELPPELQTAGFNLQVQGINMQRVDMTEEPDLQLRIPPIPSLMVIPGNIGYLNQFFSVQIFTENAAPSSSGLSVINVQAKLILPPGPDQIASTNYSEPGDDPLRFARVGPDKIIQPIQPVVRRGADGGIGTRDDIPRLHPGESGQGEFLVEGLQEGLHVMNLDLTADLEGLAAGVVKIKGKAAGSVLVRNPKFSLAFSHPRTIRAGEPYDAYVTILNTSLTVANLVSVTLPAAGLRGGVLQSDETVQFETILPGETVTVRFRILSQRTGAISFSNLTTGDDSVQGRVRLTMGIDERAVALSPDTIGMPEYVNELPLALLNAANRVLGQALSVATAALLPPSVKPVSRAIVTRRVLELAEAGQRIGYGDPLARVLADLLLDWQGARNFNVGFDQILRETEAGLEFRDALMAELEFADTAAATARLVARASDLAGRSEAWLLASVSDSLFDLTLADSTNEVSFARSGVAQSLAYQGERGHWLVARPSANLLLKWRAQQDVAAADLAVLILGTNGVGQQLRWTVTNAIAGSCYTYSLASASVQLTVDNSCDGTADVTLVGSTSTVNEGPPSLITVFQDPTVHAGRPASPCIGSILNYGTVLALLFSKPMTQERVNVPSAYELDNGNSARSVQIQPGGRVALVNMRLPFGAIRPRTLTVTGVTDDRGAPLTVLDRPILSLLQEGIALRGRVVRVDGSPAIGAPVTLTMHDGTSGQNGCVPMEVRVAQVFTDEAGQFDFDFVLAGVPYAVSATDTTGISQETLDLLLGSGARDAFARDNLLELVAGQVDVQNTLLAELGVSAIPQAIAKVEGLDRAVLRDSVSVSSGRIGSEVPVVLRFRGRGTVIGQVLAPDGVTPAAQVAVNLFPDPDSRELGRGIFSDSNGRFAFMGVPLGAFSVKAQQAAEQPIIAVGELSQPAEVKEITLRLNFTSNVVTRTELRGRVFEADNVTPHGSARVFIGQLSNGRLENLVAAVDADSSGFWTATGIPIGSYDVVAISIDGKRKGSRNNIAAVADAISYANITLQGLGVVVGKVEMPDGAPVPNALVGGGEVLVRTDANGLFTLSGVPTGQRSISAGLERDEAANPPRRFPRIGSTSVNVLPGIENFVVIRFSAVGLVVGTVRDANNEPVPNQTVAMPGGGGFRWVRADASGRFVIENLGLGDYLLSSPGPPAQDTDTSRLLAALRGESEEEIAAAIGEAFAMFTGASDPFLNGEGQNFRPGTWGFTRTSIRFDGEIVIADIRFLPEGTISGTVLNGQGVPIGARVRLTGIGPMPNGAPGTVLRGEVTSDPALGTFSFPGQAMAGSWGLQAASPFYPVVITLSGQTTRDLPDATNLVLQFPAVRETQGRLRGTVFNPDGSPVGAGVRVHVNLAADYVLTTDTNGVFDTEVKIPAGNYTLQATDPLSGLVGIASASVTAGLTNIASVQLLGKGGLRVTVLQANGAPATNAIVEVNQGTYPRDDYAGTTETNGVVEFLNIFEGRYAIHAELQSGPTTISGRAGVTVLPDETTNAVIILTPTGTLRGLFVKSDLSTPIGFAQVAIGSIGFATTDEEGRFEVTGIPIGTYRLTSKDPVTGRNGSAVATLTFDGEIKDVRLVEQIQFRGEVFGKVLDAAGTGIVAGVSVTLSSSDPLAPSRTVTTGPDGRFSFADTLPGSFSLAATDPVTRFIARRSGTLPDQTVSFEIDIPLVPVATLSGVIYRPDGVTPATNATVLFNGVSVDTDDSGRVSFTRLRLSTYRIQAFSRVPGETRSGAETNVTLVAPGPAPDFALRLGGVGSVSGRVLASDGITPVVGAEVQLRIHGALVGTVTETIFSGPGGTYSFDDIAAGEYRLSAESLSLAASHNGQITQDGEADVVDLRLGASGYVVGQLVRADGITPARDIDVLLTFTAQGGGVGRAVDRSDTNGFFGMDNIPVGAFRLEAIATFFDGLAFATNSLQTNGQVLDVGQVKLDEDYPRVVSITPPDTASGVSTHSTVDLLFNEALAPGSVNPSGLYLRSPTGPVAAVVQLLPDPTNSILRLVRITPNDRLVSLTTYEVVAIDGERRNASGSITDTGVADLVGRPLLRAFTSSFTTADNDPPLVVSVFPSNNAVQIDPRAVMRLSFNEPIRDSNYAFTVTGPAGPIAGTTSVGLNGLVLAFTPTAALEVNARYTLSVTGITDLAGNAAINQPVTATFSTLDTLGPTIGTLRIADNRSPVAGGTIPVEALLATNEPGVHIRFTRDFEPTGLDTAPPFRANVNLPDQGSTTVRAIATDAFGNDGLLAELVINVVSNEPPVARLLRGTPATGSVGSGQLFTLLASATDDYSVTNLNVTATGALVLSTNFFSGVQRTLSLTVPSNAVPGNSLQIRAQATDGLGLRSDEAVLDLEIIDQTPPQLTVLAPTNNALVIPPQPFDLVVASSDNSASHQLELTLTGALAATQAISVVTSPNLFTTNIFSISLENAPTNGAVFTATLRAIDSASNVTVVTRTFRLPDLRPPLLASTVPTNGATRQSLWLDDVIFNFDEVLAPSSISNNVVVTSTAPEFRVYAVTLANANRRLVISSQPPLTPGATYTNTLLPGITDVAGNPWDDSGGASSASPVIFTTANILNAAPTNGTRIVPGQRLPASVNFEAGLGASFFRFRMNSNSPVDVTVSSSASNTTALVPLAIDATSAMLAIEAHRSGQPHYPVAAIALNLRPRAADDDADGMTNGFEADFNFDPFNSGDALSDADGDTLSNLAEQNLGTSPLNPDTDGDGLRDNVDPEPLDPGDALRPVVLTFDIAGIANAQNMNQAYGDRVTNNVMGSFTYGGLDPFAPNVELTYGDSDPALWRTGYGSLTNILFEDRDGQGVLTVNLAADAGFMVNLHRFDLAAFTSVFPGGDPLINSLQVLDYGGNILYSTNNLRVSRTTFTQFTFSPALSDNALTIRVNALNLGNLNDDIAIDNIRFSQSGGALCGPASLVGFWPAEGNGLNSVGTNHGTLHNGVTFVAGLAGSAFNFDGVNDYVDIPSSAQLKPTRQLTVEGWINLHTLPGGVGGVFAAKGIDAEAALDWAFAVLPSGRLRPLVHRGGAWHFFDGNTALSTGAWHHVAMVYDGSALSVYLNGQLDGAQHGTGSIQTSDGSFRIGAYAPVNGTSSKAFFSGLVDELSVYDRALATNELATIVAAASGKCPPGQDTDSDGMPDSFELSYRLNPHANDASLDPDRDGVTNLAEFQAETSPRDADTDHDGLPDGTDPFPRSPNQAPLTGLAPAGPSLAFDGVNDFVNFGPWFNYQTFTIAMWIKSGTNQMTHADIIDNNHTGSRSWVAQYVNTGASYVWGGGGVSIVFDLTPGEWQFLVMTHDSNHLFKLYLDGALIGSVPGAGPLNYDGSQFLRLSAWGGGGRHWNGWVDRLAIWTTAHTAEQIYLSSKEIVGTEAGLAGYWAFDEQSGTVAADRSTNNRPATLGGGNTNASPARVPGLDIASQAVTGNVFHVAIVLAGTDPEGGPVTGLIAKLPSRGRLYQTADGVTRGLPITNAPTVITDTARRVLYAPPRAVTADDLFQYKLTDGFAQSEAAVRLLMVVQDPASDLDGDGILDSYEVAHQLDPETNDASLDPDGDTLTNLQEFALQTNPRSTDTDSDGLSDSQEVALQTNPIDPDTDDDGLIDSVDPFPLAVIAGVEFAGPNAITLSEGQTTNIVFRVGAGSAPLLMVDYPATNLPPAFATIASFDPTNTATNGFATVTLDLRPFHDAAGTYVITLRGIAANGDTGILNVTVTIDDNPQLLVSRWKDPVNGNWSDAARWTDGVPTSNHVAIIEVEGSYTVNLNAASILVKGLVLNHSNAVVEMTQNTTVDSRCELRTGAMFLNGALTHAFNGGLVNQGRLIVRSVGGGNETLLRGSALFNRGLFEVQHVASAGAKRFFVPVRNEAGGAFQVNDDAPLHLEGGANLTLAGGTFSLDTNAVLRVLDGTNPPEVLALPNAAILQGAGRIEIHNHNVLDLHGRTSVPYIVWLMHGTAQLQSRASHFEVRTGDRLQGLIGVPTIVPSGVDYTQQDGTTWSNLVSVAAGGIMHLNGAATHTFNAGLLNEGHVVVRSVPGGNETHLRGLAITNRGLLEVQHVASAGVKRFFLPVRNEAPGTFQINSDTPLSLEDGGNLNVAGGTFSLATNAVLRLVGAANPPETLTLADAAVLQGNGRIEVHSHNILDLDTRTSLPYVLWIVHGNGQLVSAGTHFEPRTGDRLQGFIGAPLRVVDGVEYTQQDGTVWSNLVSVAVGGILNLNGAHTHTFSAGLLNEGHVVVRSVAGGNETWLRGLAITNRGLFEVQHVAGTGVKRFFLSVRNEAPGTFQINSDTPLSLEDGGNLNVAGGTFSLATNAVLRLVGAANPPETLTLADAAVLQGNGRIEVHSHNILDLDTRTNLPYVVWVIHGNGQLVSAGTHFEPQTGDRLQGFIGAPLRIANGVEYTQQDDTTWSSLVRVASGGILNLNGAHTHTFNAGLLNEGHVVVRSVGGGNETHLRGAGITNRGLFEVQHVSGASAKRLFLPLRNEAGGSFQVNDDTLVHLENAGSLTVVAGTFSLGANAVLRLFDGGDPPEVLTLAAEAALQGVGRIEIYNNNIVDLDTRTTLPYTLWMMHGSVRLLSGGSHFEVRSSDRLQGFVGAPVLVADGVEYTQQDGTVWSNLVTVAFGGKLNLNGAATHTFNAALINEGQLVVRSVGGGNETLLRGSAITNRGIVEVQHLAGAGVKRFFLPTWNETGATFQLNDNAILYLEARGDLTFAGASLALGANAALRFVDGAAPVERLVIGGGTILLGTGTIHLQANNQLLLEADANFGQLKLTFDNNSTVAGNFTLSNEPGGAITFNNSMSMPGSLMIAGTLTAASATVVTINGTLTLESSGVINNSGTIRVGALVNNGGTINPPTNPPVLITAPSGAPHLTTIEFDSSLVGLQAGGAAAIQTVRVSWFGRSGGRFIIEASGDLRHWHQVTAAISEVGPGQYRANVTMPLAGQQFFRVGALK